MKRKTTMQQIGQVLVGYFIVGIFMLSFLIVSRHAKDWLGLPAPLSEAALLTLAALLAAPLALPFVLERITKLKLGGIEFDLKQASAKVDKTLAIGMMSIEFESRPSGLERIPDLTTSFDWKPTDPLVNAFKGAETTGVIEVNLGTGRSWLSSRLFLLAALADDYTDIRQMFFLEDRQGQDRVFVGSTTPASVSQAFARDSQRLKEAYEVAKREPTDALDSDSPESRVAWIASNFLSNLYAHGRKEDLEEWVTTEFLDRRVPINKYCLEWNGGPSTMFLLHQILDRIEPYVFLVKSSGQLNLVIDRLKLAERIAKDSLSERLE
jgi:hypothetical protein